MARGLMLVAALAAAGCMKSKKDEGSAGTEPGVVAPAPVDAAAAGAGITTEADAKAVVGTVVRISGTAENAKLAAVVVAGDVTVYCWDRKDGWDQPGGPVTVEGMLEHTDALTAKKRPDGTVVAGTDQPIFVIRSCTLVGHTP